ncbi:MAG: hypothetical protein F6K47_34100 [Symploca sp. SIO2E6]|nr:hypothetical protein [Symploca sp. SIO2E6]
MATTLDEKLAKLPKECRERIEAHAQELITEERALRELNQLSKFRNSKF